MKTLFIGFLMLASSTAFSQTPLRFTVNGDVSKVQPQIKMVKLVYSVDGEQKKDSAIVTNGMYQFNGELTEPRIGYFSVQYVTDSLNKKPVYRRDNFTVYLDNGNIKIVSLDSFSNTTVTGSKANEVFEMLSKKESEYDDQFKTIIDLMKGTKDKKTQEELESKYDSVEKVMRDKVYGSFVKANPSSPMAVYALNSYAGYMMNPDEVEPVYNLLPQSLKNSYSGKEFLDKLEGAKRLRPGMVATDFTQNDTLGNPFSFSSLKGKYVLVDFWASWCGPCRRENPNVVAAFNKYKDKNFTVLGVALEREGANDKWMAAIHKDKLTWNHVSDFKYFNNAVAKLYGINAIPRNFLVDPNGKILATDLRGETLENKLKEVLDK